MSVRPHRRDQELERCFRAFLDGDETALAECIERSRAWLGSVARRLGANAAEIEELVQDTWLAAAQSGSDLPADVPLHPWLAALLHHRLVSLRRTHQRRARLHVLDDEAIATARSRATYTDAVAIARGREVMRAVQSAIDDLPAIYQEALRLHLFEGLTPLEVARHLGVGRVAIRLRLFRGLRALRRALPDTLALLILAGLANHGRSQAPLWITAAATATVAASIGVAYATIGAPSADEVARAAAAPSAVELVNAAPLATAAAATERTPATAPAPLEVLVRDRDDRPLPGVGITIRPFAGRDELLHTRRASTGADGIARFATVPGGDYVVATDRGEATNVTVDERPAHVDLRTAATTLDVSGDVVDEAGRPIPGASIWLASSKDDPLSGIDVTTTGSDGRFTLRALPVGALIAARAAGRVGGPARRIDGPAAGTFQLAANGGAVTVRVVDLLGHAVPDAAVVVGIGGGGATAVVANHRSAVLPPPFAGRTTANGEFVALGVAPGSHPIVVRGEGLTPFCSTIAVAPGATTEVVARVANGVRLHGRVVRDDGSGVSSARISARTEEAFAASHVTTSVDGSFEFGGLPAGEVTFLVQDDGSSAAEHRLLLEPGLRSVEFRVHEMPRVRGVLRTESGEPLADWEATIPRWKAPSFDPSNRFAPTDAAGNVLVDLAPGANWNDILVRPRGAELWLGAGEFLTRHVDGTFEITMPHDAIPTARARVHLLTADGAPIAGAPIRWRTRTGDDLPVGTTDENGDFEFGPLTADAYHLVTEAISPDQPACDVPEFTIDAGATIDVHFRAPAPGAIAWSLRFADGTCPRAPLLTVRDTTRDLVRAEIRTATGSQALTPGAYTLHAIGDDFVWIGSQPFEVHAGETVHIDEIVRRAARRTLSLREVHDACPGERFRGRLLDVVTSEVLYRFDVPLDAKADVPLSSFLPIGRIRLDGTATNGERFVGEFELVDLSPSYSPMPLRLVRSR